MLKHFELTFSRARIIRLLGSVHDIVVAVAAFYLAYGTVYGFNLLPDVPGIHDKALAFAIISGTFFFIFSLNRGFWRYASLPDLIAIIKASAMAVLTYAIVLFFLTRGSNVPRSALPLCFIYMVVGLGGPRVLFRILKESGYLDSVSGMASRNREVRAALLYGVNENAESYIRAVKRSDNADFRIVGIVDNTIGAGNTLHGVKVVGPSRKMQRIVDKLSRRGHDVTELIITDTDISPGVLGKIVGHATECGINVSRVPNLRKTARFGKVDIQPNPINISDLLPRVEIKAAPQSIARLADDKIIFVTGAGGSIGSELVRQLANFNPKQLVISDISEFNLYNVDSEIRDRFPSVNIVTRIADIRDKARVSELLATYRPDVIFHAAALKHVPLVEANIIEGLKTNLIGTRNLADAAVEHGVKAFVMISTDKAVNPTSVMGATKRAAEAYCQAIDLVSPVPRFKTVRFGNVLGSAGSVVPRFAQQIRRGGPVTVTHPEIARYFMTIPEAVTLLLQAAGHGESDDDRGRIMVLDMGEPVRIAELARRMIELAGYRPDIDIKIKFTGLRPGEKLFEELFETGEVAEVRHEQGYMIASPRIIEAAVIRRSMDGIENAVAANDKARAMELLRHIVPEYQTSLPAAVPELPEADKTSDREQSL
ncbi:MAG: nucleoside-diphosphate sugar epimerase/dehydratase [Rhizobiaceae bacterium]